MSVNIPSKKLSLIIMDIFNNTAIPVLKEEAEKFANSIRDELKNKMRSNDFNFKSRLSKETLERKNGNIPLIDTGAYIDSIDVRKVDQGYTVGVGDEEHDATHLLRKTKDNKGQNEIIEGSERKGSQKGKPKTIPMRKIARWLEFGTEKIPARPHWRPVYSKILREQQLTKEKISKILRNSIDKRMREFNKERFKKK